MCVTLSTCATGPSSTLPTARSWPACACSSTSCSSIPIPDRSNARDACCSLRSEFSVPPLCLCVSVVSVPVIRRTVHIIDAALAGQRLDRVVAALAPELTRSAAAGLIEAGQVEVNGRPAKSAVRVVEGARVTITIPPSTPSAAHPEQIPLRIVYEDEWLVVVDKPAGMVVHPAPGNRSEERRV